MSTSTCQDAIVAAGSAFYEAYPGSIERERAHLRCCASCDGLRANHWKRRGIGKQGDATVRLFEKEFGTLVLPGKVVIATERRDGTVSIRWAQSVEQAVLETGISWQWGLGGTTTRDELLSAPPDPPHATTEPSPWILVPFLN